MTTVTPDGSVRQMTYAEVAAEMEAAHRRRVQAVGGGAADDGGAAGSALV